MDVGGDFFDLINSFIIKYLFENAKSVKFICPFTFNDIKNIRGKNIKDLLDQLKLMSESHLSTFVESIIPIVTKCVPKNTTENYDIDFIINDIHEILC